MTFPHESKLQKGSNRSQKPKFKRQICQKCAGGNDKEYMKEFENIAVYFAMFNRNPTNQDI